MKRCKTVFDAFFAFMKGTVAREVHSWSESLLISRHGDTHCHLALCINLWRHPSPYCDTFPDLATGVAKARQPRELDHILHSVSTSTYAIQEMAGWRNKKGKSGSVATLSSSTMAERARREYNPRVTPPPPQRYDKKFRMRYRLDKKSVIELAEDFSTFCILQSAM